MACFKLGYLRVHKFKHCFRDTINPLCSCSRDVESTDLFVSHCPKLVNERSTLLSKIGKINRKLLKNSNTVLVLTQTLYSLDIHHLIQMTIEKFLILQLVLSYRLRNLMNHDKLYPLTKQIIKLARFYSFYLAKEKHFLIYLKY